jgi:DNA-directed RNA polymerase
MLMTQVELEHKMYAHGKCRAARIIANNEEQGRAHNNPYTAELYKRYVLPLAQAVATDLKVKKAGRQQAHTLLLKGIDPEAVAFLTCRTIISTLMSSGKEDVVSVRHLDHPIGRAVYHEQCLAVFEHIDPALFHTLVNDFTRKLSKSERHRMTVFKMQAKERGIELPDWGVGSVQQVGLYLLNKCEQLGLVEMHRTEEWDGRRRRMSVADSVALSYEAMNVVQQITGYVVEVAKFSTPCVEKPQDWTSLAEGGFHTREMKRVYPFCVQAAPSAREYLQDNPSPNLFKSLNKLQSVKWRINQRVLAAAKQVARHFDVDEILSQADFPAPPRPNWLVNQTKDDMSPNELTEFSQWKREMANWHTELKLRGSKWGRFTQAMRVSEEFKDYPALYFVYFADFRGRHYCRTTGVSPQGSDLQKALLEFADGKVLNTERAVDWFKIAGANRWGWDKLPLAERVRKVDENKQFFLRMAADPITHNEWREADVPMQFLAWVFEYAEWCHSPTTFESRVSVGMDGSCNGLQNFSAMLRDEVGGKATNLIPGSKPSDIYALVAARVQELLEAATPDAAGYRAKWLAHGMNRTLVKRSVMTLPYGSTRFSCSEFIVVDYLKQGKAVQFEKGEYDRAARYLSHFVWEAIADVVVKAREAMDWLQASSNKIIKNGAEGICWVTPAGFPVVQHYWESQDHRIHTRLHGNGKIMVRSEGELPDRNAHKNGIAPNFIHSMDAAHLCMVTCYADARTIDALAMIHDDYGTHAADADALYHIIREVFVDMYVKHDPLRQFHDLYPFIDAPPSRGTLDITSVLSSMYFFS